MNYSESLSLLAAMREAAELLSSLDLATLPEVGAVQVSPDRHDGMRVKVQVYAWYANEIDTIDAIRTWAEAIGGVVLCGDEVTHSRGSYRQIAAVLRLPSGVMFDVWDHLTDLHPSPEWTPADASNLVAA